MSHFLSRAKEYTLRRLADALAVRTTLLARIAGQTPILTPMDDPSFAACYLPYRPGESAWFIPRQLPEMALNQVDGLPMPPAELWAGYGHNQDEYVESGRIHFKGMQDVMAQLNVTFKLGSRILDFGCAAGRMIRCFKPVAEQHEIWGVDLSAARILWCQQYLGEWFRFFTSTTFPHLPFEDNYFDFMYAGSVFTHIGDLEDAWLMELRRILKPGGLMYITVHDNTTIDLFLSSPPGHWLHDTPTRQQLLALDTKKHYTSQGYCAFMLSREPGNTQVFHDIDYLKHTWGRYLKIVGVYPEAYGYQTAVVLGKG